MRCDIIIPVWDQLEFTRDCVEHIFKNTRYPYRLVLVDNGSASETRRYLEDLRRSKPEQVTLIRNENNLGFIKAANQGLRASSAPYVCIMNNDTVPAKGWLENMVSFAESHSDAGLINPQCDGHGKRDMDEYAETLARDGGAYMEMNQCQGFCMLMKRALIDRIGVLDESFGIGGFDDTDYSMRAHLAGFKCVAMVGSYVYHRQHGSFNRSGDREAWVRRNEKLYFEKWGRHLRIGVIADIDPADKAYVKRIVRFAYGLAREWSWVHLWLNSKGGSSSARRSVEGAVKECGFPPHQNLRIEYHSSSALVFMLGIAGKLIGRMRPRMRNKRFDAVVGSPASWLGALRPLVKASKGRMVEVSFDDADASDWERAGRELAIRIKKDNRSR